MQQKKSSWYIPTFMRKIDRYLLLHYPYVWQTHIHFVLFYALTASALLFIAGYCYPNTPTKPLVAPFVPIIIFEEAYFLVGLICVIPMFIFWANRQREIIEQYDSLWHLLMHFMMYSIGLFMILGIVLCSFRMGTIVRTAHLISQSDLDEIYKENNFLYGFIPPKKLNAEGAS